MTEKLLLPAVLSMAFALHAALPPIPSGKAVRTSSASAVAEAREFSPVISDNSITFGSKKIELQPDGQLRISTDGVVTAQIYSYYAVNDLKTKQTAWGSFNAPVSTLKREGNRFVWVLKRKVGSEVWKAADQVLTVLPDNRLKLDIRLYPPASQDLQLRGKLGSQWVILPLGCAEGAKHSFNGKTYVLNVKQKIPASGDSSREKKLEHVFYLGDPAREFKVEAPTTVCGWCGAVAFPSAKQVRHSFIMKDGWNGTLILDLRKGVLAAVSPDIRGGIDFRAVEKIELPDSRCRNLLPNPSFERGLEGFHIRHNDNLMRWDWKPYVLQSKEVHSGNYALELDALKDKAYWGDDYRRLRCTVNLTTHAVVLDPGTYTYSIYAKGEKDCRTRLNTWIPNFHSDSLYSVPDRSVIGEFDLGPEWKRYSVTFTLKRSQPVEIHFNCSNSTRKSCKVWIDDIQLEQGGKATPFERPPAEGRLLTSDPQNFVSADEPVKGRMAVTTARPDMRGEALIQVKNFYGEILLRKSFPFRTDAKGTAGIALPLDDLPGLGVFVVRADYTLADGSKAYEHHRYSRVKYLNNTHRLKTIFGYDYSSTYLPHTFLQVLDRWRKLGVGTKQHHGIYDRIVFETERKYGVVPSHAFMASYIQDWGTAYPTGFCILDSNQNEYRLKADDPRILVRDFRLDGNGKITPEYLAKFQRAAAAVAKKNRHIKRWCFGGEFIAHFPDDWWGKGLTPRDRAHMHALLLKAFVAGVKEGNPEAEVFQDDPCNMRPEGGIAETDLLLDECGKLGVKFDLIAIHPYRSSPEAPDLDSDTQTLFKMLKKHGYDKKPVIWPEGMHWGPFTIPQWNVDSSTWSGVPRTWPNSLLSYDMGWTEKKSAAWYMRAYLVALKYGIGATAGCAYNNFSMDLLLTPYATQLTANTLGNLLGDSYFKADIRFAPFIRAYIFEDAQKRPVAAVWCHLDKVDDGLTDAPVAEADFGSSLEGIFDMTNSPRAFAPGKMRFAVTGFPLFFRGRPGTLRQMIHAFNQAQMISGEGISPVEAVVRPAGPALAKVDLKNFVSAPFKGTLNGKPVEIPGAGSGSVMLPLPEKLSDSRLAAEKFDLALKSDAGTSFTYRQTFDSFLVRHVPDNADFQTVDWEKIPAIPFTRTLGKPGTSGDFRLGWNIAGFFLQVRVKDPKFVHVEYPQTATRWKNDCMQFYIDTMADARGKRKGYDENDYDYAVFPNAKGDSAVVFRYRSVEQQLGLGTQAPKDNTVAKDIPCSFTNLSGVLTYRVFIPSKYLLPLRMEKGIPFGFGLYAADAVAEGKVAGGLTLAEDGNGCFNRPHLWPLALLAE